MGHIALLGDSVFDNAAYNAGQPWLAEQVQRLLPSGWAVTSRATEGSLTRDVLTQLEQLPAQATHIIVSAGGNDARSHFDILGTSAHSTAEVLTKLADITERFQHDYQLMLAALRSRGLPMALCTIYPPRYRNPIIQRMALTALAIFNHHIIYEAFAAGLPLLDLRLICDQDDDYSNPVKLSAQGGAKLAAAITKFAIEESRGIKGGYSLITSADLSCLNYERISN